MITVALFVFGCIFGSFVSALTYRMYEQSLLVGRKGKAAEKRRQMLSMTKGRSMCPTCQHELAPKDLVPVLSWLLLRGKCRYCRAPIPDSPITELVTGALFAVSYLSWPHPLQGVWLFQFSVWLGILVAFVALAVYDLRWFLLPDKLVYPLIGVAVVYVAVSAVWLRNPAVAGQACVAAAIIFGLFWTLFQVSKGEWIGGGDVKLAVVLGLVAGTALQAFLVIFLASLLGTLGSIPFLIRGRSGLKVHIPFGPYLLAATILVVLYGERLAHWYQGLFLI